MSTPGSVGWAGLPSDAEALSAATRALDVGVVEDKLGGELGVHIVHLGAQQGELGLLLDEHTHACREGGMSIVASHTHCIYITKSDNIAIILTDMTHHPARLPHQPGASLWCSPVCR